MRNEKIDINKMIEEETKIYDQSTLDRVIETILMDSIKDSNYKKCIMNKSEKMFGEFTPCNNGLISFNIDTHLDVYAIIKKEDNVMSIYFRDNADKTTNFEAYRFYNLGDFNEFENQDGVIKIKREGDGDYNINNIYDFLENNSNSKSIKEIFEMIELQEGGDFETYFALIDNDNIAYVLRDRPKKRNKLHVSFL